MKKVKITFEIEMTDDYYRSEDMQGIINEINSGQTAKEMMDDNEELGIVDIVASIETI